MSQLVENTQKLIKDAIIAAISSAIEKDELPQADMPDFIIEKPSDKKNGDFSTNVAMAGARVFRKAPALIAKSIVDNLSLDEELFEKIEIAGAGFINFYLSQKFYSKIVLDVLEKGADYGKSDYGSGKSVLVEFVSANPTGPMHIGNARGGAIGDCLASVLEYAGFETKREFYVNDAGNQIEKFATSLEVRYLQLCSKDIEMPEDAYHGADITEHAKNFFAEVGDKYAESESEERRKALVDFALPKNIEGLERDLKKYRITYDRWFRESTLHNNGAVERVISALKDRGVTMRRTALSGLKQANTEMIRISF